MSDGGAGRQSGPEPELGSVLESLRSLSGEVEAGYVISGEGRVLASTVEDEAQAERAGAMVSALSGLSNRRARESSHEGYSQVRVRVEEGYVLLTSLAGGSTLAATTGPEARAGLVLYDMRNARAEAERALPDTDEASRGSQR